MTRHFIIGMDSVKSDQTKAISAWLNEHGCGWWHWVDGMWLIDSDSDELDVVTVRDKICEIAPGVNNLVLEVDPDSWAGYGPQSEKRDMFKWLKDSWIA